MARGCAPAALGRASWGSQSARRRPGDPYRGPVCAGHVSVRRLDRCALGARFPEYRVQPRSSRNALELVFTPVGELEPGSDDEVDDGPGPEDLPRLGQRAHARTDMHSHAADVLAKRLALPRMHAGAQRHAEVAYAAGERLSATDRSRWTSERREDAIAECLDQPSAGSGDLGVREVVMVFEKLAP